MKPHFFRTNLPVIAALIIVCAVLTLFSCQKTQSSRSSNTNNDPSNQFMSSTNFALQNESLDDQDFDDAFVLDNEFGADILNSDGSCKTITYDPAKNVYPHTKTVVYNNCVNECKGGTLNGTKITYNYIDPSLAQPGDLVKETIYQGLTVDDTKVTGDIKVYLVSDNPRTYHITGTRTFVVPGKGGATETAKMDYTRTQIEGGNTKDRSDDVYAITGSSSGHENVHGGTVAKYTAVVDNNDPLIKENGCCSRTAGTETITLYAKTNGNTSTITEVLDYGDGSCDNDATLSINGGEAQPVTLPLLFWPLNP